MMIGVPGALPRHSSCRPRHADLEQAVDDVVVGEWEGRDKTRAVTAQAPAQS